MSQTMMIETFLTTPVSKLIINIIIFFKNTVYTVLHKLILTLLSIFTFWVFLNSLSEKTKTTEKTTIPTSVPTGVSTSIPTGVSTGVLTGQPIGQVNKVLKISEEDLIAHDKATEELRKLRGEVFNRTCFSTNIIEYLKSTSLSVREFTSLEMFFICLTNDVDRVNKRFDGTYEKNMSSRKKRSTKYNRALNYLRGHTKDDCFFHKLLKRDSNGGLIKFRDNGEKDRSCSLFEVKLSPDEQKRMLPCLKLKPLLGNTKKTGLRVYLEEDQIFSCVNTAVENIPLIVDIDNGYIEYKRVNTIPSTFNQLGTYVSHVIKDRLYGRHYYIVFRLKIPISHGGYMFSDCNWLKQYGSRLHENNVSNEKNLLTEESLVWKIASEYKEYHDKVCQKIEQLINSLYGDDNFAYMILNCSRREPACDAKTLCLKRLHLDAPINCIKCGFEMCNAGCGQAHHGGKCHMTSDEASMDLISSTSKNCPQCNTAVFKDGGCNHITCQCRCEFCWICGEEYEMDEHNRPKVTEHYRDGNCNQFDGNCNQFN